MAYASSDDLITVRGSLPSGEVWANSWATICDPDTVDYVALKDAFHNFYDELATGTAPIFGEEWSATSYSRRHPSTGFVETPAWSLITGDNANDHLPTECAIRISINDGEGGRGGPFLAGFVVEGVTADGLFKGAYQNVIHDALQALVTDLADANAAVGLNHPTSETVTLAAQARVGQVFDVIRRRRSDISENYVSVTLA